MARKTMRLAATLAVLALVAAACSSDGGNDSDASGNGGGGDGATLKVPGDYATIQEAVDAADPGSLILIAPGVYEEEVNVTTDDLVIRGLDRNETILDGNFEMENGIRVLEADGVAIENLTAQNYTRNGFFWTGVDRYRGSYLNAIRNGDYGVYAFGSTNGVLEHSYASGSPDAGFYIGQCFPCDAVIDNVISEWNGLGYSGTNSGGNLYIINSTWRYNRAGIVPNSGSYEGCAPETESTLVGNIVHDNGNPDTDAIDAALLANRNGIVIAGGNDNVIERNLVFNHEVSGIALAPFPEDDPIGPVVERPAEGCTEDAVPVPDEELAGLENPLLWFPNRNSVIGNVITDSGEWDLVVIAEATEENCFADNDYTVSSPADIEAVLPCDGTPAEYAPDFGRFLEIVSGDQPPPVDYTEVELPDPGDQPNMPDPEGAPAVPAGVPPMIDLAAIAVPDRPEGA